MPDQGVTRRQVVAAALGATTMIGSGCLGPSEPPATFPTVKIGFDYDPDAELLTISHSAGDPIAVRRLYIRGRGFAPTPGADLTAAGGWAGQVSGTRQVHEPKLEEVPAVKRGDVVSVGAAPDYKIRVEWQQEESDRAWEIDTDSGPEA
jgi:hypothetical protein